MNKKKNDNTIEDQLKKHFDAVSDEYIPDEDELRFLNERRELEEQTAWSFEMYVENYEKLKEYGLEEKLIKHLEWFILFYLENRREYFIESEFYKRFRNHEAVKRAEMELERKMKMEK
jgi:hypothetical protein